jgi:hypothetical protein
VNLDFPRGAVTCSSGKHKPQLDSLAAAISFVYRGGVPVIMSHLNGGEPFPVALWTGGPTGLWLSSALAEQLVLPIRTTSTDAERQANPEGYPLAAAPLNLGGFEIREVSVTVGWPRPDGEPAHALLGSDVLRKYLVTIDYKAKKIYLESP